MPTRNNQVAGVSAPRPASHSRQGVSDLGAEASLKIPSREGRDGPAMRPRAVRCRTEWRREAHRPRKRERPRCASGKSAWRTPTPKFGPGTARSRGLLFSRVLLPRPVPTLPQKNRGYREAARAHSWQMNCREREVHARSHGLPADSRPHTPAFRLANPLHGAQVLRFFQSPLGIAP